MWLKFRMYLLVAVLFAILYGVLVWLGSLTGIGNSITYLVLAFVFLGIQYLLGPTLVGWTMGVKYVTEQQEPVLHQMVTELAQQANLPKPKVGISEMTIPNAFAFGRTQKDGRICVTRGILNILNRDELRAVLGHEMSHIKHRDMAIITLLSAIPMVLHWIAFSFMWGFGDRRERGEFAVFIGIAAFVLYFITNLLVLYGSRIREYYADLGSTQLGNQPQYMATALYKLAQASIRPRVKEEMKKAESVKAFFVNDPSRAAMEVRDIMQIDRMRDGIIGYDDLLDLRQKQVRISFGEQLAELFMTHPNMVRRIKHLSGIIA